jgi:hypothetical protein
MGEDLTGKKMDPVCLDGERAFLSSREIKEYLLCDACEQKFCRFEDYVSKLAYQDDGRLGLLDLTSVSRIGRVRVVPVVDLDCRLIVSFAALVFWRAHVSSRPECRDLFLWNPQAEALRLFLLGNADLPSLFCFTMHVLMDGRDPVEGFGSLSGPPATAKKGANSLHQLIIAGLVLNLSTGDTAARVQKACLHCGQKQGILVSRPSEIKSLRTIVNNVQNATLKGKLSRLAIK